MGPGPTAVRRSGTVRDRLREGVIGSSFEDGHVQAMLGADVEVIEQLDETITKLETHVPEHATVHDPNRLHLLQPCSVVRGAG